MNNRVLKIMILGIALVTTACGSDSDDSAAPTPQATPPPEAPSYPIQLSFNGVSEHGAFDPSIAHDPSSNRLWMAYSAINKSLLWEPQNHHVVSTRLAYSDNQGESWTDHGEINDHEDVTLNLPAPNNAATWINEVSDLVFDPGAPENERWKLIWHHYLLVDGNRRLEHGWIAMKMAAAPEGLASAQEIKLVGSAFYDISNNTKSGTSQSPLGGAPEIKLHSDYHSDLNSCVFTEPSLYATDSALYASLQCTENSASHKIFLLKCNSPCDVTETSSWQYLGIQLETSEATHFGFPKFSAPEIVEYKENVYLMTSAETNTPFTNAYNGCHIFRFNDLDAGTLETTLSQPDLVKSVSGTSNSFNGACTFHKSSTYTGIIYSEISQSEGDFFRLYYSGEKPD